LLYSKTTQRKKKKRRKPCTRHLLARFSRVSSPTTHAQLINPLKRLEKV